MACRKGELRSDGKNRSTAAAAPSVSVGDALLFTTMCIIGMPVDVHVRDGSVYYGIFHTASVDKDYAIVLKKARMIKKGKLDANVVDGTLIETLIVRSEDLVQVVAKRILLPSNRITNECLDRDSEVVRHHGSKENKKHRSQSRFLAKRENISPCTAKTENVLVSSPEDHIQKLDTKKIQKIEEAHTVAVVRRQVGDGLQEIQNDCHKNPEFQDKRTISEVQRSSPSITSGEAQSTTYPNIPDDTMQQEPKRVSSDEIPCTASSQPNISVAPESCLSATSNPFVLVPPKSSGVKKATKESKLNPGAKMFSPTMLHHRTVTTSAVQNGASAYVPEVDANSFAPPSLPVKFIPYSNVTFGHGGSDASFVQPIIGQMVNRTQAVRYPGQYQNFQTGPAYVHPKPQNVMLGRVGPLVCVHPISGDVVQSAGGFSAATTRPLFTQHPMHLPKHQGNASTQALQLCMSGAQPYVMPNSIPISQPLFPVLRPIANSFLTSKFA